MTEQNNWFASVVTGTAASGFTLEAHYGPWDYVKLMEFGNTLMQNWHKDGQQLAADTNGVWLLDALSCSVHDDNKPRPMQNEQDTYRSANEGEDVFIFAMCPEI